MTLLRFSNLSLAYQGDYVFQNISGILVEGRRTGIIGPNGSGKSSLVKVLLGYLKPCQGQVTWVKKVRTGYVPQDLGLPLDTTPAEICRGESAEFLGKCGVGKHLWNVPVRLLSGGQRTRVALASALSSYPELIVLDEPTNHLDMEGMEWLETFLARFSGTVLLVSHDRFFLDSVVEEIWDLRNGKLQVYPGRYSDYLRLRKARESHLATEFEKWSVQVRNLKVEIANRRAWYEKAHRDAGQNDFRRRKAKKHARQFKAKEARLEKLLSQPPEKPRIEHGPAVDFRERGYRTRTLIRATEVSFSYPAEYRPDESCPFRQFRQSTGPASTTELRCEVEPCNGSVQVLDSISVAIGPGEKVGLVGPNGSGKTTLLKLIAGQLVPCKGVLWRNPNIKVGFLPQMLEELDPNLPAHRNVSLKTGLLPHEARNLLGLMGISGEMQTRPLGLLSMGERTRVALTCLTAGSFDLLLLDEPTNHLDIPARERVEEALRAFSGALIVATHDRYLLKKVSNVTWYLKGGHLEVYRGAYGGIPPTPGGDRTGLRPGDETDTVDTPGSAASVLKIRMAYLASKIAAARDSEEKAALDARYQEAVEELRKITRGHGQGPAG
ncbi:MAG TPA: ABC-F family ATP-binding cassette domain-containing protein [Firmicutes bacterium]|nr:ABC-F family ATP-binding cassette domain-containing protein [Candidatus Fermentithermobacillaceae bacterium]